MRVMGIEDEAEKILRAARAKAIRSKIFENLSRFTYQVEHMERGRYEADWLCRLTPRGPNGEIIRGLRVTVKTPSQLDFDRTYDWPLISLCPVWIEVYRGEETYRYSMNTKRILGLDN